MAKKNNKPYEFFKNDLSAVARICDELEEATRKLDSAAVLATVTHDTVKNIERWERRTH